VIAEGHELLFTDRDFQPFVDRLGLVPAEQGRLGSDLPIG